MLASDCREVNLLTKRRLKHTFDQQQPPANGISRRHQRLNNHHHQQLSKSQTIQQPLTQQYVNEGLRSRRSPATNGNGDQFDTSKMSVEDDTLQRLHKRPDSPNLSQFGTIVTDDETGDEVHFASANGRGHEVEPAALGTLYESEVQSDDHPVQHRLDNVPEDPGLEDMFDKRAEVIDTVRASPKEIFVKSKPGETREVIEIEQVVSNKEHKQVSPEDEEVSLNDEFAEVVEVKPDVDQVIHHTADKPMITVVETKPIVNEVETKPSDNQRHKPHIQRPKRPPSDDQTQPIEVIQVFEKPVNEPSDEYVSVDDHDYDYYSDDVYEVIEEPSISKKPHLSRPISTKPRKPLIDIEYDDHSIIKLTKTNDADILFHSKHIIHQSQSVVPMVTSNATNVTEPKTRSADRFYTRHPIWTRVFVVFGCIALVVFAGLIGWLTRRNLTSDDDQPSIEVQTPVG